MLIWIAIAINGIAIIALFAMQFSNRTLISMLAESFAESIGAILQHTEEADQRSERIVERQERVEQKLLKMNIR